MNGTTRLSIRITAENIIALTEKQCEFYEETGYHISLTKMVNALISDAASKKQNRRQPTPKTK